MNIKCKDYYLIFMLIIKYFYTLEYLHKFMINIDLYRYLQFYY